MKQLSIWAKKNPIQSRVIITISHLLIFANAFFTGLLLVLFDWHFSAWILMILVNIFFLAYVLYPDKRKKSGILKYSYIRQKSHDFILVFVGYLVMSLGVSDGLQSITQQANTPSTKLIVHKTSTDTGFKKWRNNTLKTKQLKKKISTSIKALKKDLKASNKDNGDTVAQVLLILLCLLVSLILTYGIVILACGIACSGNEALAVIFLIAGIVGLIWLNVIIIKKILRRTTLEEGKAKKESRRKSKRLG